MNIVLARIDDRLIHGQVATIWSKDTKCQRIIVCNDDVTKDLIRKTLLEQATPPGIKSNVLGIDDAIKVYSNPRYQNDRVLFLFTNPTDVVRMVKGGVVIKSVNIGGMSFKQGKKQITRVVSVDDTDVEAFKTLNEKGIELEIRKISSDSKVDLMSKL
ncbi:mannose/fructose/sorbose PTS transporter subunit IIB [Clostridium psychrophilum]|uniref:mannose/fructose/sorbose PTS transporter subunit IIB n=1 Tax=Clostridium psychrophilum TaxID=132926 RepID=UPI001C0ACF64|nr:mannose/fructose/sorbose PTS transporter subunit IIB [Clostridium psychrophilum]MBU3181215.1 mannose/fructose/sorbose PTS transporter subunit IIB [Clostridium psychrophilum]